MAGVLGRILSDAVDQLDQLTNSLTPQLYGTTCKPTQPCLHCCNCTPNLFPPQQGQPNQYSYSTSTNPVVQPVFGTPAFSPRGPSNPRPSNRSTSFPSLSVAKQPSQPFPSNTQQPPQQFQPVQQNQFQPQQPSYQSTPQQYTPQQPFQPQPQQQYPQPSQPQQQYPVNPPQQYQQPSPPQQQYQSNTQQYQPNASLQFPQPQQQYQPNTQPQQQYQPNTQPQQQYQPNTQPQQQYQPNTQPQQQYQPNPQTQFQPQQQYQQQAPVAQYQSPPPQQYQPQSPSQFPPQNQPQQQPQYQQQNQYQQQQPPYQPLQQQPQYQQPPSTPQTKPQPPARPVMAGIGLPKSSTLPSTNTRPTNLVSPREPILLPQISPVPLPTTNEPYPIPNSQYPINNEPPNPAYKPTANPNQPIAKATTVNGSGMTRSLPLPPGNTQNRSNSVVKPQHNVASHMNTNPTNTTTSIYSTNPNPPSGNANYSNGVGATPSANPTPNSNIYATNTNQLQNPQPPPQPSSSSPDIINISITPPYGRFSYFFIPDPADPKFSIFDLQTTHKLNKDIKRNQPQSIVTLHGKKHVFHFESGTYWPENNNLWKKKFKTLPRVPEWYFRDQNGTIKAYDNNTKAIIMRALGQGLKEIPSIKIAGRDYKMDLDNKVQYNTLTGKPRDIYRESDIMDMMNWEVNFDEIQIPEGKNVGMVEIKEQSEEFKKIANYFYLNVPREPTKTGFLPINNSKVKQHYKITKIQKIYNPKLRAQYEFLLQKIKRDNNNDDPTIEYTRLLWHGTGGLPPPVIYEDVHYGWKINYSSAKNLWGPGLYFGEDAMYCDKYVYRVPDSPGKKQIFLAEVIIGDDIISLEDATIKEPWMKEDGKTRYDSVCGVRHDKSWIWIVYASGRAYPSYLVDYEIPKN